MVTTQKRQTKTRKKEKWLQHKSKMVTTQKTEKKKHKKPHKQQT